MSLPSDALNSEMDYLWRAVGEAQDASARSEAERAEARKGLQATSAKAQHLEGQLAESLARERRLKDETESLKAAIKKDSEILARAAGHAREAAEFKAGLIKKETRCALMDAELAALQAETGSLREALAERDAAIESFKEKVAGLMSLPELARTLRKDSKLSGKQESVYEYLLAHIEAGKRAAEAAAADLAASAERENHFKASLAASVDELSGLRAELPRKRQELAALEAAMTEALSKEKISAGEKASLEGRSTALKAALSEKEAALVTALSDCAALRAGLDASGFEAERLREAADEQALKTLEQRSNFSAAVAQVFELQKRAAALKSALGQAQEQNAALTGELKERAADMEKVSALLKDAKNGLGLEKDAVRNAGAKILSLEGEIEALKTKITASANYSADLLKAVEERDLEINKLRADLHKIEELEIENEDLRRKNIKFTAFLKREQTDFNTRMITALEKAAKDLKGFNLRIPAAERRNLEPAMKNLLASVNLLKGWQEYLDPETPELEETDLAGFVSGEAGKWDRAFKQRKISISAAVLNPRLRTRLSPERMKMLFYHLIKNACERLQQGGSLRVALKGTDDGRHAAIRFEDSGPGFSQEALSNLYAPFNSTEKGKAGIGLAVAHRIAEKHGGTLEVSNKKERGAIVEVRLPLGG
ncbi:MAG: ATP-binding protein [Elusimicrobiota bacterium]|nr:ATP-binding protein [Elusimicrobiota bacterium]